MNRSTTAPRRRALLAGRESAIGPFELQLVTELLAAVGCESEAVADGAEALDAIRGRPPDAVIIAEPLATVDSLDLCRRIRAGGSTVPVAVVTIDDDDSIQVDHLDAGADDVMVLPLAPPLLRARLCALLRRIPGPEVAALVVGDIVIDRERRSVTRAGRSVDLTLTEFGILELLMRNADIVLPRSTIYERLWGIDLHQSSKSLDVHVGGLRQKLERHGERVVHNVRGVGYVMWSAGPRDRLC